MNDDTPELGSLGPGEASSEPEVDAPHTIGSLLILLSVPCALPVPGIGNVMGAALMGVALLIWRSGGTAVMGRPALGRTVTMDSPRRAQLLQWLQRIERLAGRWCRPRMQAWTRLPARSWQAAAAATLVATMGAEIFLPIPLGNLLPAASLTLLGLALKYRDGLAVVWSLTLAAASLSYPFLLGAGAWMFIGPAVRVLGLEGWIPG